MNRKCTYNRRKANVSLSLSIQISDTLLPFLTSVMNKSSRGTQAGRQADPRPRIATMSALARKIEVDHGKPLGYYYRLAGDLLEEASKCREEKNLIDLYVALLRFSSLISETIPDHRYYHAALHRVRKEQFKKKLVDVLEELEALKPDVQRQLDELHKGQGHGDGEIVGSSRVQVRKEEEEEEEEEVEEEDCVILDFPPTFDFEHKLSLSDRQPSGPEDEDVSIIAEKGPVACRDFPHSRHLCANYPFNTTAHETFCPQCYCYVCDVVAPCENWKGSSGHCHASDHDRMWKDMRNRGQESGRQS